jgi:hypothetical protein
MLQDAFEDDNFLKLTSSRRLVNISGTVNAIDLKFSQVKYMGLPFEWKGIQQCHHYHGGRNWNKKMELNALIPYYIFI